MLLCKDCRHFIGYTNPPECEKTGEPDLVLGVTVHYHCKDTRGGSNLCGPEAEWFEPKPPKKSILERIFG